MMPNKKNKVSLNPIMTLMILIGLAILLSGILALFGVGATNPAEAAPGTIRGDFGLVMDENVIHGSDSPESAEREIGVFFPEA